VRIETEPPGAEVYIDGVRAGIAPVEYRFVHYGTLRVDAWLRERPAVTRYVELEPPWYQSFPFEFFAEVFDPRLHVDRHEVLLELPAAVATPDDLVFPRAEELRARSR